MGLNIKGVRRPLWLTGHNNAFGLGPRRNLPRKERKPWLFSGLSSVPNRPTLYRGKGGKDKGAKEREREKER